MGTTCTKGACQTTGGGSCTGDTSCGGATPHCVGGQCVPACDPNAANTCGDGKFCNQGACVPDTRPHPTCTSNSDCPSTGPARACVEGFCRFTCSSIDQCLHIDARLAVCSNSICKTSVEGQPQCTTKVDCSAGLDCISNLCR
jgi:hypothetical protein